MDNVKCDIVMHLSELCAEVCRKLTMKLTLNNVYL